MYTVNDRIKELRTSAAIDLSMEDFGKMIGVGKSAISNMEHKRSQVTDQTILAVCRTFNVNEKWLREGEGPMNAEGTGNYKTIRKAEDVMQDPPGSFRRQLMELAVNMPQGSYVNYEGELKEGAFLYFGYKVLSKDTYIIAESFSKADLKKQGFDKIVTSPNAARGAAQYEQRERFGVKKRVPLEDYA